MDGSQRTIKRAASGFCRFDLELIDDLLLKATPESINSLLLGAQHVNGVERCRPA